MIEIMSNLFLEPNSTFSCGCTGLMGDGAAKYKNSVLMCALV